ncbi:MAG TPA: family 43 glycosylhydrolase [Anaerolineales bacterium]
METYLNPVYTRSFPDPFVLKHRGEFWAYCSGFTPAGGCFGLLRSPDLVHWEEMGAAMDPLPEGYTCYRAPETVFYNGRFYLYYSAGNETRMQIRVAMAHRPGGPFVDSGRGLTTEDFAIDPHVFQDEDGARYLFYATRCPVSGPIFHPRLRKPGGERHCNHCFRYLAG